MSVAFPETGRVYLVRRRGDAGPTTGAAKNSGPQHPDMWDTVTERP